MSRLLYISFILVLLLACNNTKKQEIERNSEHLKESFISKNEIQFLNQFPKDFNEFKSYFGWDVVNDKPQELYKEANSYIDYWFNLISKYKKHEKDIINVCKHGAWQPDAANYFQDKTLQYIKDNKKYSLINELSNEEAKTVLFFLFDNNNLFKNEFVSHLTSSKKNMLDNLIKKELIDANENPKPENNTETSYNISDYINDKHYFIKEVDINKDGMLDKIVSAAPYQGDELLLFVNKKNEYQFALKTINFSEDGGNQIKTIKQAKNGFVIITAFLDGGFFEAHHHISFIDKNWVLTNTIYKTMSSNQEDAFLYVCDVKQGIDIGNIDILEHINLIPDEANRDKICVKQKNNNLKL